MDIEPLCAALPGHYTPGEAAAIERVLREYNGTIPDKQLISEAGLALAIHRRRHRPQTSRPLHDEL